MRTHTEKLIDLTYSFCDPLFVIFSKKIIWMYLNAVIPVGNFLLAAETLLLLYKNG